MDTSWNKYFEELEAFYAHPDIATWKAVLGTELHYHFGFFPEGDESLQQACRLAVESLYRWLPKGNSVLDAGCGWGGPLNMLVNEHGMTGSGVTISEHQATYCRSLGLNVERANLESYKLTKHVDAVLLIGSVEHIRQKRTLFKTLRSGASSLVMHITCTTNLLHAVHPQMVPPGYMFFETPEMIVRHLKAAGWNVKFAVDQDACIQPTLRHWLNGIIRQYGDQMPPGHLGALKKLCEYALGQGTAWEKANPLLEVYAE